MTDEQTCYRCDAPAVGDEHVPPRCFVPNAKRENAFHLLPACFEHNQARSADDDYTRVVFALVAPSTYEDPKYLGSVARAMGRRDGALGRKIREGMSTREGLPLIKHDTQRTGRVFQDIAAALFFIETGRKALGPALVSTQGVYTRTRDPELKKSILHNPSLDPIRDAFEHSEAFPVQGKEPSVLWYQVAPQGSVRFYLNESVENLVLWPWCDPTGIFRAAASDLAASGRNPQLQEAFARIGAGQWPPPAEKKAGPRGQAKLRHARGVRPPRGGRAPR